MNESTLITAEALIVTALLAWSGAWRDTYKEYRINGDPIWHSSLSLGAIYIAVLCSLLSLIFAVWSLTQSIKGVHFNLAIGFAGYSATILFLTATLTALTTLIKAGRGDMAWHPLWVKQTKAKCVTITAVVLGIVVLCCWLFIGGKIIGTALAPQPTIPITTTITPTITPTSAPTSASAATSSNWNWNEIVLTVVLTIIGSVVIAYSTLYIQKIMGKKQLLKSLFAEVNHNVVIVNEQTKQIEGYSGLFSPAGLKELHSASYNTITERGFLADIPIDLREKIFKVYDIIDGIRQGRFDQPVSSPITLSSITPGRTPITDLVKNIHELESQLGKYLGIRLQLTEPDVPSSENKPPIKT